MPAIPRFSLILIAFSLCPGLASAAYSTDPDRGMSRALGIEEAWAENAFYFNSARDNDSGPGHSWNLGAEWDIALDPNWGLEVDFPGLLMSTPIGQGPSSLAPITVGLKSVPWQWGTEDSPSAGVLGLELEGSGWVHPRPRDFPGAGNSLSAQALLGLREKRAFLQGEYGWSQHLSADARSGWFADTALGYTLNPRWAAQIEWDLNHLTVRDNGNTGLQSTLIPQFAWQVNDRARLALGEAFTHIEGQSGTESATDLLFEYAFGDDSGDAD